MWIKSAHIEYVAGAVEPDFAQYLQEPHKGFPDAENQVQGVSGQFIFDKRYPPTPTLF